ncbi:hypothetical protein J4227_01100 [Candidatus Woesearchaeota archaeon]|nr:hypothetical protein [Candidatus Woesearchaeota archaeon]
MANMPVPEENFINTPKKIVSVGIYGLALSGILYALTTWIALGAAYLQLFWVIRAWPWINLAAALGSVALIALGFARGYRV